MQAFYDSKPPYLEAVGNGSYVYRFNIEEVVTELTEENAGEEKVSQWKCEEGKSMGTAIVKQNNGSGHIEQMGKELRTETCKRV